jgi:hypothetical protein
LAGILLLSRQSFASRPEPENIQTALSPHLTGKRMNSLHTSAIFNRNAPVSAVSGQQVEAARYAVLRRLSPSLRHHMVRHLQPIGLIHGVMEHRLSRGEPDVQALRVNADKMNEFAKAALTQCLDIGTWLAPEPDARVALEAGVMECVGLLATTLHFRGFRLINEVENLPCQVRLGVLRMVLIAVLLEVTDALDKPANLTLSASAGGGMVTLQLQVALCRDGRVEVYDDGYRKLAWSDVQALAFDEAVSLSYEDALVTMRFPIQTEVSAA